MVMLRSSRSKTLSKMNAFDFFVTIAFGSTLSTIQIDGNITLGRGIFALA